MATSWFARTDRLSFRTTRSSISSESARRAIAHASATSSSCVAKMTPSETSPTPWPDLPIRWTSLDTSRGELYCNTKSALPTSMPSSKDDVHTRARSRLALNSSSICTRTSFDRLPWWTPIPGSWYQAVSRELGPPFVGGELVDLVDHDPTDGLQMLPQPAAGEQDLERLRRRDEHVRRVAGDRGPLLRRRVSMSDVDTDPEALREEGHPAEHVAVEGPQRRAVQDARRLRLLPDHVLEERQERRLRLPDAGRGHQEDVRPRQDPGDRLDLRLREFVDPQGLDRVEDGGSEAEGLHGGRLKGSSD